MSLPPHLYDQVMHKAFASNIRKNILLVLSKKPRYLSEIAVAVKKKPQTVDFHLNLLREIGLIESKSKDGKRYYSIKNKKIIDLLKNKKAVPIGFRPKPPHEIVLDMWKDMKTRMDKIDKRLERIEKKLK